MQRRSFLSMFGASALTPILPARAGVPIVASAGYNRYMYGLAVFHARTHAKLSTADLMTKLRIGTGTAEAMMGEMRSAGIMTPALNAAAGFMRTVNPHQRPGTRLARRVSDRVGHWVGDVLDTDQGEAQIETCTGDTGDTLPSSSPETLKS